MALKWNQDTNFDQVQSIQNNLNKSYEYPISNINTNLFGNK